MVDDIVGRAKRLGIEFPGATGKDLQRFSDLRDFLGELSEEANELAQIGGADFTLFDHVVPKVKEQLEILSEKLHCAK